MDLLEPLYDAIEQNNLELGKKLLREATSGNKSEINEELLHFAVFIGDTEITKLLLDRGTNVNYKNDYGMTALHFAVSLHCQEMVNHLPNKSELMFKNFEPCTNNASIKWSYYNSNIHRKIIPHGLAVCYYIGYTYFLLDERVKNVNESDLINGKLTNPPTFQNKSKESNTEIIELLLNSGADINASLDNGKTPLHLAVECGHIGNLQVLLNYKPNINCSCTIDKEEGYTPLHLAVKTPKEEIIDMILSLSSRSINASSTNGVTALHSAVKYGHVQNVKTLLKYKPDVNCSCSVGNEKGYTPLHFAAEGLDEEIVEMLINFGCEINSITERGITPLHVAVKYGRISNVKILLQHIADVNYVCNLENEEDYAALHFAAKGSNEDIIEILLSSGSCINATTKNGKTPLILAVENGQVNNVTRILKWNADVNNVCSYGTEEGYSALHFAAKGINENIVGILLKFGANVTAFAKNGKTALHLAVESNLINNVKHLLQYNQEVNISCNSGIHEGYTPLHFAAKQCNDEMIELFLKSSGNINSISKNGKTPLHLAVEYDRINNVKCLLTHNADVNNSMASSDKEEYSRYVFDSIDSSIKMIEKLLQNQNDYYHLHFYPKELTDTDAFNVVVKYRPVSNCTCVKENVSSYTPIHFSIKGCSDEIGLLLKQFTKHSRNNVTTDLHNRLEFFNTIISTYSDVLSCRVFKYIPDSKCSCSSGFSEGYTPLHFAAQGSNEVITEILLNHGADLNAHTSNGESALYLAVENGYIQNINLLLKYKPDLNLSCTLGYHSGYTPLHVAAAKPDKELLELLLNNGANVNACTSNGESPLFPAVKFGHIENIQILLKHKPDVNGENNKLAFLYAVTNANTNISVLFENYGFNINDKDVNNFEVLSQAIVKKHLKIWDKFFRLGSDVNSITNAGEFLIHVACRSNNDKVFKHLLKWNVEVNVLDARGYTPLHILISNKRIDLMKEILDYGADVNLKLVTEFRYGLSPLNLACDNYVYSDLETEKCIKLLLEYKPDINSSGEWGDIPLCKLISLNNSYDMVKLFLELGADVNKHGKDGETALHVACNKCSNEDNQPEKYINLLLNYGADVTLSSTAKYTPLHVACSNYLSPAIISHKLDQRIVILLENGSDLTMETSYKQTPVQLYLSCYFSYCQRNRNIPQKFIHTTVFLIEQLVMRNLLEAVSLLIEQIPVFRNNYLYSEDTQPLCTDLRSHFSECEKEITNLKNENIKGVCLYDILAGSVQMLATHEIEDINTFFEYNIREKFPIYSNSLVNNIKKVNNITKEKRRQDLLKRVTVSLNSVQTNKLPDRIIHKIIDHLNESDLNAFNLWLNKFK